MITVKKDDVGIKFYYDEEKPSVIIYDGSDVAIINEDFIVTSDEARLMAQLMYVVSVVLLGVQNPDGRDNVINVEYRNSATGDKHSIPYSPKKIFDRIYTGAVVAVDRKHSVKYKFESFGYENGSLIVFFSPVIW